MNILIVHHSDNWGGAGVSLRYLVEMLKDNHNIVLCVPHMGSKISEAFIHFDGIICVSVEQKIPMISAYNGGPSFLTRTFFMDLNGMKKCADSIVEIVRRFRIDYVILNSITLSWLSKPLKKNCIKNLVYIRETKPKFHIGYYLEKRFIERYADGAIFISEYDYKEMGIKTKHYSIVRDCVKKEEYEFSDPEEWAQKYKISFNGFKVLYVGGDNELKGYKYFIDSLDHLDSDDYLYLIAGKVNEDSRIDDYRIKYLGEVFIMPALYSMCDVLVFPAIRGHQARPIFEAGFACKPVIATDFPQICNELINGYNGFVIAPRSSKSIAEKIVALKNNTNVCRELGNHNYEHSVKRHDFINCKQELLSFLKTL